MLGFLDVDLNRALDHPFISDRVGTLIGIDRAATPAADNFTGIVDVVSPARDAIERPSRNNRIASFNGRHDAAIDDGSGVTRTIEGVVGDVRRLNQSGIVQDNTVDVGNFDSVIVPSDPSLVRDLDQSCKRRAVAYNPYGVQPTENAAILPDGNISIDRGSRALRQTNTVVVAKDISKNNEIQIRLINTLNRIMGC